MKIRMDYSCFKLHRLSDSLVYAFDRKEKNGVWAYKRRDGDYWIIFKKDLGWVAFDEDQKLVQGRPWDILLEEQSQSHPPEGIWVSRKGKKSYVYNLQYIPGINT